MLEARRVPKVSVALLAGDPSIVRDAGRNGRSCIARPVEPLLRASPAHFFTRGAQLSFDHGSHQVRDDVIMLTFIE